MEIKVKKLMFNKVIITGDVLSSSIILSKDDKNTVTLKEVQTVVAVGPVCSHENGSGVAVGDRVVIDPTHLKAQQIAFRKDTGEYVGYGDKYSKEDLEFYYMITDRDIVMILE